MATEMDYRDRCCLFGMVLGEHKKSLTWLYQKNIELDNKSPKDMIEEGKIDEVIKVFEKDFKSQGCSTSSAMEFHQRELSIPPSLILDEDNGVDFTFKGMGLKGNRKTEK